MKRTRDKKESSVQVTPGSDLLEAWRAAGLTVIVVERCSASRCEICDGRLAAAA